MERTHLRHPFVAHASFDSIDLKAPDKARQTFRRRRFALFSSATISTLRDPFISQMNNLIGTEEETGATGKEKDALGEVLEFVSNPDNLWSLTKELLSGVIMHVRSPRYVTTVLRGISKSRRGGEVVEG